mgnify:CR=1 FL=1
MTGAFSPSVPPDAGDDPDAGDARQAADAAAVTALTALLRRRMTLEGPMSVAAFMTEALAHPRWGYYQRQDPFGVAGDFITAPEISQMFGELLGLWCVHTWSCLGSPVPFALVELGPGRGTLMRDALRAAALVPAFRNALRLHMVETSPTLRAIQARTLADCPFPAGAPVWHDHLADLPEGPCFFLANEFFDALPIRQVIRTPSGWAERRVDVDPDGPGFRFVLDRPMPDRLAMELLPESVWRSPPGSLVELCPTAQGLMAELAGRLVQHGGAALVIDYGYPHAACGETLQALRRHQFVPVLETPGAADLTAHVNFESLVAAARTAGARAWGPVDQGAFLKTLGLAERAALLCREASPDQAAAIAAASHRLTAADAMGTLFKVLAITAPTAPAPVGFS